MGTKIRTNTLTHDDISNFVMKNFAEVKNTGNIDDLVHFHSINKFLLMAHSYYNVNVLGRLVSNNGNLTVSDILFTYERQLRKTLKKEPTIESHANVLEKISGYFKKDLTHDERSSVLKMIANYRNGQQTLGSVLLYLESLTERFQKMYLVRQTYLLLYL